MKNTILLLTFISSLFSFDIELSEQTKYDINKEMFAIIYKEAMDAKKMFQSLHTRDELIEGLSSTAPREEFIANVDISAELLEANPIGTLYLSTDGQNTWTNAEALPLNEEGYENTWQAVINNNGDENIVWYISAEADSEPLGFDYGRILVSQTPFNNDDTFPPASSKYALLATDPSGDASSNQDITEIRGTYGPNDITLSMKLNGSCCQADNGFFGPWFLYGMSIINPEAEAAVAYAIGYGDGGFLAGSQLYPALYKLTGDFATGELGGFEVINDNINYNTSGNYMQASTALNNIVTDSDWGIWPNSFQGIITLGVTVEAGLSGTEVVATVLDQSSPGLMLLSTQIQNGNTNCEVSWNNLDYDNNQVTVNYIDAEGNLPWFKSIQLCEPGDDGLCFYNNNLIANEHTYLEGTTFYHTFPIIDMANGSYVLKVGIADGEYTGYQIIEDIFLVDGLISDDVGCVIGDANGDTNLNVLDVVLTVNSVLCGSDCYESCVDMNGDGVLNVLDIVLLVNTVLG